MDYFTKKVALVKRMDKIMRSLNDEDYVCSWLTYGCPDEATQEDYEDIASSAEEFLDLVSFFTKICEYAMKDEGVII